MKLRERKTLLESQITALAIEVWQIEQQLAQELAGVKFDLFAGMTKAELEELLSQSVAAEGITYREPALEGPTPHSPEVASRTFSSFSTMLTAIPLESGKCAHT